MAKRKKTKGLGMHNNWYDHDDDGYWQNGVFVKYKENDSTRLLSKTGWNTGDEPKVCTNCDFVPKDQKIKYFVDYEVWRVMLSLCSTVKVEWQALLKGSIEANGDVKVTGYHIPKQEVTGSTVKNLEVVDDVFIAAHHIVAGIHSHSNMSVFFSSTDHEHTNMSLIKHNIVINNRSEYKAQSRIELPCGMVKFVEAEILTLGSPQVVITGLENITEKQFGFNLTNWAGRQHPTPKEGKQYTGAIEGIRWCPTCNLSPEEDDGSCACWTNGKRAMLPDFTLDNYVKMYATGRSWELKPILEPKYKVPPT